MGDKNPNQLTIRAPRLIQALVDELDEKWKTGGTRSRVVAKALHDAYHNQGALPVDVELRKRGQVALYASDLTRRELDILAKKWGTLQAETVLVALLLAALGEREEMRTGGTDETE